MAHEDLLAELDRRRTAASRMGGADKLAKRKSRGQLNAQERLEQLVDPGSFIEVGLLGASGVFKEDEERTPRDGKLVGFAKIEGRDVGVVVNDFTVAGASTSATNSKKMAHVRRTATEKGMPFVHVGESTGARLPDAMGSRGMGSLLGNDPTQFRRLRETPWVAAALDTSFGSSAWLCCCSDFAVMRKGSIMAVSSPRLVSMAIGEQVDLEELGGWRIHADYTGLIDRFTDTDAETIQEIRTFLGYMPSHNMELPPAREPLPDAAQSQETILDILPEKRTQVYDMRKIIEIIADRQSVFELKPRFGRAAVTALARLGGKVVGVIANNPLVGGGRAVDRCGAQDHRLSGVLRQLQHPAPAADRYAGLRRRQGRRAEGCAGLDHEHDERHLVRHRAVHNGHRAGRPTVAPTLRWVAVGTTTR